MPKNPRKLTLFWPDVRGVHFEEKDNNKLQQVFTILNNHPKKSEYKYNKMEFKLADMHSATHALKFLYGVLEISATIASTVNEIYSKYCVINDDIYPYLDILYMKLLSAENMLSEIEDFLYREHIYIMEQKYFSKYQNENSNENTKYFSIIQVLEKDLSDAERNGDIILINKYWTAYSSLYSANIRRNELRGKHETALEDKAYLLLREAQLRKLPQEEYNKRYKCYFKYRIINDLSGLKEIIDIIDGKEKYQ